MSNTDNKDKLHFGWAKIGLIVLLLIIGFFCLLLDHTVLATLLFIGALCVIFGPDIADPASSKKRTSADTRSQQPEPEPKFVPEEHGELIACPFCSREIPSDISFCFYCGRNLESYKQIESVRVESLNQIDDALQNISKGTCKASTKDDISQIRDLTDKILRRYGRDPENRDDYDRFISYYLPKTVRAIGQYGVLCTLTGLDREQTDAKIRMESSFDQIAESFGNIYNRLSTEGLLDISADISALENILKLKGLTDPDFKIDIE